MQQELKFSDLQKAWDKKTVCTKCKLFKKDTTGSGRFDKCSANIERFKDFTGRHKNHYIELLKLSDAFPNWEGKCIHFIEKISLWQLIKLLFKKEK